MSTSGKPTSPALDSSVSFTAETATRKHMALLEDEDEGFVIVPTSETLAAALQLPEYLDDLNQAVGSVAETFWPVNKKIHDNPETKFKEFIAHDVLTKFMRAQQGWVVTPSAYGMETAWVAVYDSGGGGPVVSFNAEMGMRPPVVAPI